MKFYDWNEAKNAQLKMERDVCFEDVVAAISEGNLLDVLQHTNQSRYRNQQVYVIKIVGYIYLVPIVEDDEKYFLKTIYASRKMTKKYLFERRDK